MKILLPNTMPLNPRLPDGWESIVVDVDDEISPENMDAEALVVWGASRRHLESAARGMDGLRLVQTLSAGVDSVLSAGFRPGVMVASGSGLHDRTVTEHTLALILMLLRRLPASLESQSQHEWSRELGGIQELHPAHRVTTLLDANVLVWGFGNIAQTLAPVLRSLGAKVTGVAHQGGERGGFPV
ncbi:MAG: NAD(P)-dependent oxidoreductase, partial [Lacisediminihabitans sp.]